MGYVVKVEGKNKVLFADKLGGGTENVHDAQVFHDIEQAWEVRDIIQDCVGKNARAYLEVLL
jgi:hypothetical protein